MRTFGRLLLRLLGLLLLWQLIIRILRRLTSFPVPACMADFLDTPLRRRLQPPAQIAARLDIRPGMQALELGPGPGTFTREAARLAGPQGQINALDIEPRMLHRLQAKLAGEGVANVRPLQGSAHELPLATDSLDRAFMVTVLAEIPDPVRALREVRRVLRPDGLLSVSEFLPDPDYPRRRTVTAWAQAAGFIPDESFGNLFAYTLNFRPGGTS